MTILRHLPPPANWRQLVDAPKGCRRFYIELEPDEDPFSKWLLIDAWRGDCIGFSSEKLAKEQRAFANRYVKKHGDINLQSFPYTLDDEYHPPVPEEC